MVWAARSRISKRLGADGRKGCHEEERVLTRIRDIRLIPLAFVMAEGKAYGMARGQTARRENGLIEVETEDGVIGIGEAFGPPKVAAGYLDLIKEAFIGRTLFEPELVWSDIISRRYHLGLQNQMTACYSGINIACYEALGKTLGVPVADLLGGRGKERIPAYASTGTSPTIPKASCRPSWNVSPTSAFPPPRSRSA